VETWFEILALAPDLAREVAELSKRGRTVIFHGAYSSKADARKKERARSGAYIIERKIRGRKRYIVVSDRWRRR
jgi:hypothetical protein